MSYFILYHSFQAPSHARHVGDAQRQHLLPGVDVVAVGGGQVLADRDGLHVADQASLRPAPYLL